MNSTLRDFFLPLASITVRKSPSLRLPYFPILLAGYVDEALSNWITKRQPTIPLSAVKMNRTYMHFDCLKSGKGTERSTKSGDKEKGWRGEN